MYYCFVFYEVVLAFELVFYVAGYGVDSLGAGVSRNVEELALLFASVTYERGLVLWC